MVIRLCYVTIKKGSSKPCVLLDILKLSTLLKHDSMQVSVSKAAVACVTERDTNRVWKRGCWRPDVGQQVLWNAAFKLSSTACFPPSFIWGLNLAQARAWRVTIAAVCVLSCWRLEILCLMSLASVSLASLPLPIPIVRTTVSSCLSSSIVPL